MNRIIKFRAWDDEHKRWLIKGELQEVGHYEYGSVVPNTLVLQDERNERILLNQYIGEKDKNGKQIYEGDIVKAYSRVEERTVEGVVSFISGSFAVRDINTIGGNSAMYYIFPNLGGAKYPDTEIIGNIYESPTPLSS